MEEKLIAPCGMNCNLCINYLAMTNNLNQQGFKKKYCPGCIPRGKNCSFLKKNCSLLGEGLIRFCFECGDYPCDRLKNRDMRYSSKYHMSLIANLVLVKEMGMAAFLIKEEEKWKCPKCGQMICCHNGLCLKCDIDTLRQNKKYRWEVK